MVVNTITAEVQQVAEWEEQDEIREVEKGWVAKANEANVECVH